MDTQKLKDYGAILGYVIGFTGFAYGFYKDRRLRAIEKRGKAPYFVASHLEIDADFATEPVSGEFRVTYPSQPREINADFAAMLFSQETVYDDYPDGRILGIVLENHGTVMRSFTVTCKAEHLFQRYCAADPRKRNTYGSQCYTFRYRFQRAALGKPLTFTIRFEVESGFRGKQVWRIEQGILKVQRVKPKSA